MSKYLVSDARKVTTKRFGEMKQRSEKITMLTSYDYTMASIVDQAGVDAILVGDSAANVMAGYQTTLPITLDQMIYHASSVARAVKRALILVDMPFGTYQGNADYALECAVRIMKESGADALKLEGGVEIADSVKKILSAGIPICAHLGLTPQSINKFGGYTVRAKEQEEADKLLSDALLMDSLGCFALVLEKIPAALAAKVTSQVKLATIGIGAGNATDGQVLVVNDMLGMDTIEFKKPRFVRQYESLNDKITNAVGSYITDVKGGSFPTAEESY